MPDAQTSPLARPWPREFLPAIRNAGQFPLDDRGFRTTYRHATYAIHVHLYAGVVKIGPHRFELRPGDCTLSPPGTNSAYDLARAGTHWCVHFRPPEKIAKTAAFLLPLHIPLGPRREFIIDRLRQVAAHFARGRLGDPLATAAASAALQEALLWIAMIDRNADPRAPRGSDAAIEKLLAILHARFTEPLRVEALADEVELTQNYLARRFRQRFGMTIPRYLLTRRIDHARYLLSATDMPIHRIAQRVGLADPQHFNKQFRRLIGQSPTVFRAATRERSPR